MEKKKHTVRNVWLIDNKSWIVAPFHKHKIHAHGSKPAEMTCWFCPCDSGISATRHQVIPSVDQSPKQLGLKKFITWAISRSTETLQAPWVSVLKDWLLDLPKLRWVHSPTGPMNRHLGRRFGPMALEQQVVAITCLGEIFTCTITAGNVGSSTNWIY